MQSRFFRVNSDCTICSAHHLLRIFAHKRSVTVSELSDYITRRKKIKSQYLNEVQNGCTCSRIRIELCRMCNLKLKSLMGFTLFESK